MHLPACRELSWRLRSLRREGVGVETGGKVFDPMGFSKEEGAYRRKELQANELFNGRLSMLAITGFAVQEFLWQRPVIEQTPFFFGK